MPAVKKRNWGKIGAVISFLALILLFYQLFYQNPKTEQILGIIAGNTYTPKPFLTSSSKCYIIEPSDIIRIFGLNVNESYYLEIFTIKISNTYATNPWLKIILSNNLDFDDIATSPPTTLIKEGETPYYGTDGEEKRKTVTSSWEKSISPDDEVKIMLLYNKDNKDLIKNNYRYFEYGSKEVSTFSGYSQCYDLEIFNE